jgi:hypothetical protein
MQDLLAGVPESSVESARTYVTNLKTAKLCQVNPADPACTTPPTSVAPTTTTKKGI